MEKRNFLIKKWNVLWSTIIGTLLMVIVLAAFGIGHCLYTTPDKPSVVETHSNLDQLAIDAVFYCCTKN